MSKRTKGPWCVESATNEALHDVALDYDVPGAGRPVVIATTNVDDFVPISSAEAEANARLMAAAPDLLAACKAALAETTKRACFDSAWGDAMRSAIEAAIVKAEGRAS